MGTSLTVILLVSPCAVWLALCLCLLSVGVQLCELSLTEPRGWVCIRLYDPALRGPAKFTRCHILQIVVVAMHQSGKDTHVRQVKVFGPSPSGEVNHSRAQTSVPIGAQRGAVAADGDLFASLR